MKWPSWIRGLVLLRAVVRSLDRLEVQLRRIADAHEGISPPARAVPDADTLEPSPLTVAPPGSTRPQDQFVLIDRIEQSLTRSLGRPPTPEELVHELDDLEWGAADLTEAQRQRLGL